LLIYFAAQPADELLGAYLVRTPSNPAGLDGVTAIGAVTDPELAAALSGEDAGAGRDESYPIDPFLKKYTGFFVERDNYPKLPKEPPRFVRNAIVRLGEDA
jgi:hypothetical protein